MQFTVTQRIYCGLTIPNGKNLVIDDFIFLPDFAGAHQAEHIQVTLQANTEEEAKKKSEKMFKDFLAKLTLIDNSKYILREELTGSIAGNSATTHTVTISAGAFITQDGNRVKENYEKNYQKKSVRKKPIRLYRDAINSGNLFSKYRDFYRVLDNYGGAPSWIKNQIKKPIMKKYIYKGRLQNVTIFTWLRHRMSHSRHKEGVEPLLESNPQHVSLVQKYLPKIQELARKKIKEREGI